MKIIAQPDLPKEFFAVDGSTQLLAQAVRVHRANQRQGTQSALTRHEVSRTRKKLYKQKGTGGARHGDRKAPIFVGGGVSFAPKPRDYSLSFNKKMRLKAIQLALSLKLKNKQLLVADGLEKATGKTKELADFLGTLSETSAGRILLVTDINRENVHRAGKNIAGVTIMPINMVNTYEILNADTVLLMDSCIEGLKNWSKPNVEIEKAPPKKEETVAPKKTPAKKVVTKVKKTSSKK